MYNILRHSLIFIDDVRCFVDCSADTNGYPSLNVIVEWCRKNNLVWTIENDIFVALTDHSRFNLNFGKN